MKKISFKECIHTYFRATKVYNKKKRSLSKENQNIFETRLQKLESAIAIEDKKLASEEARKVSTLLNSHFPLSRAQKLFYKGAMVGVALFFAIMIRQSCFELHEIPSGSMRPTFRESDKLVVSKTQFGLNIPLMTKHFAFNPDNVKRMGTCVFSADGLDTPGVYTTYFYLFPGVKRFVKRVVGLPEDRLYFYGGKIYGIDKDGNDISHLLQQDILSHIEHIPFIQLPGKVQGIEILLPTLTFLALPYYTTINLLHTLKSEAKMLKVPCCMNMQKISMSFGAWAALPCPRLSMLTPFTFLEAV
ncbi:S26 family signal peptidase [bacterium]|nr:S26 family signal peptidase [bacterium]